MAREKKIKECKSLSQGKTYQLEIGLSLQVVGGGILSSGV
jgi:hypothetical protein